MFTLIQNLGNDIPKTVAAAAALLLVPTLACAMGTASSSDETYEEAQDAVESGDFEYAIDLLRDVLEDDTENADAYNLLAYSQRNLDQFEVAMENYRLALEIDPDHLGALEYQGELFLKIGDRQAAEANLVRLTTLCPRGCEEQATLQAAIERFKDGKLSWRSPPRAQRGGE